LYGAVQDRTVAKMSLERKMFLKDLGNKLSRRGVIHKQNCSFKLGKPI